MNDVMKQARELADELQHQLGGLSTQWGGQGRRRLRKAVGGHSGVEIWSWFGVGLVVGGIVGAAVAYSMMPQGRQTWNGLERRVRERMRPAGDGQPVAAGEYEEAERDYAAGSRG